MTGPPGSARDPYYPAGGNGGYDVSHYDLRLKYQPTTDLLEGTATIIATATQDLTRFNLDFGLAVSEVRVGGKKARFATSGDHELEVTPADPPAKGGPVAVVVRYAGKPSELKINGWTAWARTPDGGVAAQEPESAVWWYPSNDHPLDKATYDISVSVPDGTQAISNGVLQSQSSKLGRTRFTWRSDKPQATYLSTLAIGRFDITTDRTADGPPVLNAYSKDLGPHAGAARASIERTTEVAEWLTGVFGRRVEGHWIKEGFARYSQWLWSEKEGEGTAQELADHAYAQHPADDPFWEVEPGDPGPDDQFDIAVYDRGSLALQALRNEVGEDTVHDHGDRGGHAGHSGQDGHSGHARHDARGRTGTGHR